MPGLHARFLVGLRSFQDIKRKTDLTPPCLRVPQFKSRCAEWLRAVLWIYWKLRGASLSHSLSLSIYIYICTYIYIYIYVVTPHDPYEALLLYCQHNLLHAALLSEEPKTL